MGKHISHFGGDTRNITVGGLSAGAHSALLQTYYDSFLPVERRLVKRCYLWSNALAVQPYEKDSEVLTSQFESLCRVLGIEGTDGSEKLESLREVPTEKLIEAISKLELHTFRTCTDGVFLDVNFLKNLMTERSRRSWERTRQSS